MTLEVVRKSTGVDPGEEVATPISPLPHPPSLIIFFFFTSQMLLEFMNAGNGILEGKKGKKFSDPYKLAIHTHGIESY